LWQIHVLESILVPQICSLVSEKVSNQNQIWAAMTMGIIDWTARTKSLNSDVIFILLPLVSTEKTSLRL